MFYTLSHTHAHSIIELKSCLRNYFRHLQSVSICLSINIQMVGNSFAEEFVFFLVSYWLKTVKFIVHSSSEYIEMIQNFLLLFMMNSIYGYTQFASYWIGIQMFGKLLLLIIVFIWENLHTIDLLTTWASLRFWNCIMIIKVYNLNMIYVYWLLVHLPYYWNETYWFIMGIHWKLKIYFIHLLIIWKFITFEIEITNKHWLPFTRS